MEGIRELGRHPKASDDSLKYVIAQDDHLNVTRVTTTAGSSNFETCYIRLAAVRTFLQHEEPADSVSQGHSVKLIQVPSSSPGVINVDNDTFQEVLGQLGLDLWIGRLVRSWTYGYHHSTRDTRDTGAPVTSYYLGTGHFTAIWTTTTYGAACYATKGVIIAQRDNMRDVAGKLIYDRLVNRMALFDAVAGSPLYLPFVLAVDILTVRESIITDIFSTIRAHHGTRILGDGLAEFMERQDGIKSSTPLLGKALNHLADIYKHLNIVDLVFKDLKMRSVNLPASKGVGSNTQACTSTKSITDAIAILCQQSVQVRDQAQYLEVRVRSQLSVLFSLLTHQDAAVNIRVANASMELAEATRRDGSSMKTIAILSMAFLPATFFAAFVSIPSLGWTQPDKFALFWACTLPVTVATFLLWASITQRNAMSGAIARLRRRARGKGDGSVFSGSSSGTEITGL